ncbi:hypothetical protein HDU93_002177 [Gonapodya sp. JEL0774]|nr:hypothetical protein HDU93_002177 [Gonapodya sp. JEL0774]
MTAEFKRFQPGMFVGGTEDTFKRLCASGVIVPVMPSRWCVEALDKLGINKYVLAPHGADPLVMRPRIVDRTRLTKLFGSTFYNAGTNFMFLSVGSMLGNKGITQLISAFAQVRADRPHARLFLKGFGSLYGIPQDLQSALNNVKPEVRQSVMFTSDAIAEEDLAYLYNCADAYVSPYLAEGFCVPVLEAFACGVPVIVSSGAVSDEYLPHTGRDVSWLPIDTQPCMLENGDKFVLPSESSLYRQMMRAIDDRGLLARSAVVDGLDMVHNRGYSWKTIADNLLSEIRNGTQGQ